MLSAENKLRVVCAFAMLATLASTISCTGFFQNPTLSSISVGPAAATIETGSTGNTVQMTVFGTNNDGSTTNSPSVSWTITPTSVATISSSGLVTSASTGTATVTATSNQNPSISGTQTVNVTVGCIQSIKLQPSSGPPLTQNAPTDNFTAQATTCNGTTDVTTVATWTSSNTSLATVSAGAVTMVTGNTTSGSVNITAAIGNVISPAVSISVTP